MSARQQAPGDRCADVAAKDGKEGGTAAMPLSARCTRPGSAPVAGAGIGRRINPKGRGLHSTIWKGAAFFPDALKTSNVEQFPDYHLHQDVWADRRGSGVASKRAR